MSADEEKISGAAGRAKNESALYEQLCAVLGADHVLNDQASRELYSQDVAYRGGTAQLIVRPASTEQLTQVVRVCAAAGIAIVPRGGGMSYTAGYLPQVGGAVVIDSCRMNRVLDVNRDDMTVTVEAGCTWQALHEALEPHGLRTPYWGTLSGRFATVGGSVSQNSIFWGSGQFGFAPDSVLSMDVVLADGSVLSTGSAAKANTRPFLRQHGPDITGLFTGDCGALGCKATVTLRLLAALPARRYVSIAFEDYASQSSFMSEISRRSLAMECFGFDPFLQEQRMRRESLATDVKALGGVMRGAGGLGKGLKEVARIAMAGRRYMDDVKWSLHLVLEDHCEAGAVARLDAVRKLIGEHHGRELENTIPKVLRANPFGPVNNMVGPNGERWAPVHALVPHSLAGEVYARSEAVFAAHRQAIEQFDIGIGYLVSTVSTHCFVLEPVFFWPDQLEALHRHAVEDAHLERLQTFAASPEARAAVMTIRTDLVEAYAEIGAAHLQVGRGYAYCGALQEPAMELVRAVKRQLDPNGLMNPGVLGLD